MRALSLRQYPFPYASLIAYGLKENETRSLHFFTQYRGLLAIHATRTKRRVDISSLKDLVEPLTGKAARLALMNGQILMDYLPYGKIVAVAELTDCLVMTPELIKKQSLLELAVGWWSPGRVALKLENVRKLDEPIPIKRGWESWGQTSPEIDELITAQI